MFSMLLPFGLPNLSLYPEGKRSTRERLRGETPQRNPRRTPSARSSENAPKANFIYRTSGTRTFHEVSSESRYEGPLFSSSSPLPSLSLRFLTSKGKAEPLRGLQVITVLTLSQSSYFW